MLDSDGLTHGPGTTGRTLVLMEQVSAEEGVRALRDTAGLKAATFAEREDALVESAQGEGEGVVFDGLSVAVVDAAPDQFEALQAAVASDNPVLAVEPERIVYALRGPLTPEYFRGFEDAVAALGSSVGLVDGAAGTAAPTVDETNSTWGLQAVGALTSAHTGRGVRVAVLDTGMDLRHPDFGGRNPVTRSFIAGEAVQDGHGHGTHCIGTACGPRVPGLLPRYGVAPDAQIFAGKVLSNRGSGGDQGILAGISWAIANRCQVVSMSLGAPTTFGQPFSRVFEAVGQRALRAGTLIVAAAGNESRRDAGIRNPVGHPANCPSFLAVGAIDVRGAIANFSCTSDPRGGQVDIAGPGVAVYSSWPMPRRNHTISGTSMATPHVAGVAALLVEARGLTGLSLWGALMQTARRLPLPSVDVGAGLAKAP